MRLRHYNAAARGGTGNAGAADSRHCMDVGGGPLNLAGRQPQLVDLRYSAHHRAAGAGVGPERLVGEVAALPVPGGPEPALADDGPERKDDWRNRAI